MFLNFYCYLIFIPMVIITNLVSFSLMSWFSMWMNMEINLINFLMILIFCKMNKMKITMNYFLIQTFNSYLFLFSSLLLNYNNFFSLLMIFSMLSKMGFPPFHYWYFKIFKSLSWMNIFYLSTIQKIIPLISISLILNETNLLSINMIIINVMTFSMIYSILGTNINSLKLIMAYSSIIQMSWIIILMIINEKMSFLYLLIYSTISYNLIFIFKKFNLNSLKSVNKNFANKNKILFLMMSMMSLASLPPYFGFMMKWISILMIYKKFSFMIITLLILNSLISMFFYIRIMVNSIYKFNLINKINLYFINYNINMNWMMIYLNWMFLFLLISFEIF